MESLDTSQQPGARFSVMWALATCFGGTLSWVAAYAFVLWRNVSAYGTIEETHKVMYGFLEILVMMGFCLFSSFGMCVGIAQVALLKRIERPGESLGAEWIIASTAGWWAIVFSGILVAGFGSSLCTMMVSLVMGGVVLSLLQWLPLRNHYDRDPAMRGSWTLGEGFWILDL